MTLDLKDRLYTSSEVAEILGVSLRSVYRYLEEGKLDADIKTATGRHRFSKKNILDFLKPQETDSVKNTFSSEEFSMAGGYETPTPALKANSLTENRVATHKKDESLDDFNFDFDEEFFKSLEDGVKEDEDFATKNPSNKDNSFKEIMSEDDELEKLLKEFEEEGDKNPSETPLKISTSNKTNDDEEEFELDKILRSLEKGFEEDTSDFDFKDITPNNSQTKNSGYFQEEFAKEEIKEEPKLDQKKDSYFDFDMDFDFDFLDKELDKENEKSQQPQITPQLTDDRSKVSSPSDIPLTEQSDDSEDNWLERFRRAAEKNSPKKEEPLQEKKDKFESFFEDTSDSLDVFFGSSKQKTDSIGISSLASISDEESDISSASDRQELFYISDLTNLKEIAQTVDKVARKFDLDYAFTLNAGLSLHKPIAPFSIIHGYVNKEDVEIFEDYLKLTPCSEKEASVCLITPETKDVFEDAHELHGLYVVSNVQLRSDLIDKGLDKLAREI